MDELERIRRFRAEADAEVDQGRRVASSALDSAMAEDARPAARRQGVIWKTSLVAALGGVVVALAVALTGGGGRGDAGAPPGAEPFALLPELGAAGFAIALGGGNAYPEFVAKGPAELANRLEQAVADPNIRGHGDDLLVAEGEIKGFSAGRIYTGNEPDPAIADPTVVMRFAVDRVFRGELPSGSQGVVYVERWGSDAEMLESSLPANQRALLYLAELSPEGAIAGPRVNPDAGHPPDQPLFGTYSPQGLMLEDREANAVIQPDFDEVYPNSSLREFAPPARAFPRADSGPSQ